MLTDERVLSGDSLEYLIPFVLKVFYKPCEFLYIVLNFLLFEETWGQLHHQVMQINNAGSTIAQVSDIFLDIGQFGQKLPKMVKRWKTAEKWLKFKKKRKGKNE